MRLVNILLWITLLQDSFIAEHVYDDYEQLECPTSETISGGLVEYSNDGEESSVLTYKCPFGFEPYPMVTRSCSGGKWTPMVTAIGTPIDTAECKELVPDYDEEEEEEEERNCSLSITIKNGQVSFSNGGLKGSVLTYSCPSNYTPYPTSQQVCGSDGKWSPMKLPNGKTVPKAVCKVSEILCPSQLQFDHGDITPRQQWFKVGENQEFACFGGFQLQGSAERVCTMWGDWTGEIPVCVAESDATDCPNPGVPPGAWRSGNRFRVGDKVQYRCDLNSELLGSAVRECLQSREWSGAPVRCQAWNGFDSPNTVANAMGGSLSSLMDYTSPEFKKKAQSYARKLEVSKGRLNVFILMDSSGSISEEHFNETKAAIISLIEKLDSYEVTLKFHIISFATAAKVIVNIHQTDSHQTSHVVSELQNFKYGSHGKKTGTNLQSALKDVHEHLSLLKTKKDFKDTPNVILITTDGHSNTGGSYLTTLRQIRGLFGYTSLTDQTDENLLDVYVFGIGEKVNKKELNQLASKKRGETHLFVLKDYPGLNKVFNLMISDKAVTMCGTARELVENKDRVETRPWHVKVYWDGMKCQGSLLSESWVITAAHCLKKPLVKGEKTAKADQVTVTHGNKNTVKVVKLIIHPQYDVKALRSQNVDEFYDYDIALIKTEINITASVQSRPICLPCTVHSSRALKMVNSTCKQHENALLDMTEIQTHFMSVDQEQMKRLQTHIQKGPQRLDCINHAKGTFRENTTAAVTDVVTDRFMCTGGSKSHKDAVSCKGDSGGALFLRKGMRYFQVGVLSWGTTNVCESKFKRDDPPPQARDFHINLFSLMPWLKQHLSNDLTFVPLDN